MLMDVQNELHLNFNYIFCFLMNHHLISWIKYTQKFDVMQIKNCMLKRWFLFQILPCCRHMGSYCYCSNDMWDYVSSQCFYWKNSFTSMYQIVKHRLSFSSVYLHTFRSAKKQETSNQSKRVYWSTVKFPQLTQEDRRCQCHSLVQLIHACILLTSLMQRIAMQKKKNYLFDPSRAAQRNKILIQSIGPKF